MLVLAPVLVLILLVLGQLQVLRRWRVFRGHMECTCRKWCCQIVPKRQFWHLFSFGAIFGLSLLANTASW